MKELLGAFMDILGISSGSAQAAQTYSDFSGQVASGVRLTDAGQGAAEIAVADLLNSDLAETRQGIRNLVDGVSMLQTADGALGIVSDNLVRMKQLAMQSQSGILSDEQQNLIRAEMSQLMEMNTQIGQMTTFNDVQLLQEGQVTVSAGSNAEFAIDLGAIAAVTGDLLADAEAVMQSINAAAESVSMQRGQLGADMTRMENYTENLQVQAESLLASQSAIRDMNMAQTAALATSKQIVAMQVYAANAHNRTVTEVAALLFAR
jgi:flagellin